MKKAKSYFLAALSFLWLCACSVNPIPETEAQPGIPLPSAKETAVENIPDSEAAIEAAVSDEAFTTTDLYSEIGLPDIKDFSDTAYEDYGRTFPSVAYAVLSFDEQEEEIAADDPRLMRLLNYILYSEAEDSAAWTHGLLTQEDVQKYRDSYVAYLTVVFSVSKDLFVPNLREIIIFPDRYLLVGSNDEIDDYVQENFPYEMYYVNYLRQTGVADWQEEINNPEQPWIDLLEIGGFVRK